MAKNKPNTIEQNIWKELAGKALSPSHDRWHVDRVLDYALRLQSIYGGDMEVLEPAVIMHDLGRSDPLKRGEESIEQSLEEAKRILDNLGNALSPTKKKLIIKAISEHDKPDHVPTTLEGRILKDADFMAGFGAWGILRIAMWAGETGEGISQILERLEKRMKKRVDGLSFRECRQMAIREFTLAKLFLSLLHEAPELPVSPQRGRYVLLEGISGSGKNTQAESIRLQLQEEEISCHVVVEPGDNYKRYRDTWQRIHDKSLSDPLLMRHLLISDRYQLIKERVIPSLEESDIVLSVRGFISTIVYQGQNERDMAELHFLQRMIPTPDLVIILDLDPEMAADRIRDRTRKGIFETAEKMKLHRQRYIDLATKHLLGLHVEVIDASKEQTEVTRECLSYIRSVLDNTNS